MKMNFKFLALAAAALTFAACTDELVQTPEQVRNNSPESNAISFSTYMGKTGMTRAGQAGSYDTHFLQGGDYGKATLENWTPIKAKAQGFGVFGYYTGKDTYGQYQKTTYSSEDPGVSTVDQAANFMFNQLVWWNKDLADSYVTKWTYSPLKYWPNEVKAATGTETHDVDDQNNNSSNDPALGSGANGGNVSFFAYAPYVSSLTTSETNGITAINKKTTLTGVGAANAVAGDPIISYKLPSVSTEKAVDLLWGTAGVNGTGVAGAANTGVQGDGDATTDKDGSSHADKYKESILDSYRTNADLTKQTTEGTVNFAFKHALAKIGGSYTGTGVGDDEDGNTPTNGLLVILDLDDLQGAESGGSLEKYLATALEDGSKAEWNKYNTKVTINELVIECSKELTTTGTPSGESAVSENIAFDYSTMTTNLKNSGDFNLATGKWSNVTASGETKYSQTVLPSGATFNSSTNDADKDAVLSEELAEPTTAPAKTKPGFESLPIGVTTVAKNVYESEANPLVFIPGTKPIIEFTITYTVRTYDPNLSGFYTEVKQKIKKNLYILKEVELNKQYNILMHLGLTSVKFTATVSDWDVVNATGTTTDPGDGTSPVTVYEDEVEHVYLPINVGEPASVAATVTANSLNANLTSKAFTVGSATAAIGTVDAMTATFTGESAKPVEVSHVTMQAVDKNGNLVDWITYAYDNSTNKGTITVANNISPEDRTATIRIIYDGVADEYTITQKGVKVQDNFTVNVYTDAARTIAATLNALPSASTKYYTKVTANYRHVDKDDNVTTPAASLGTFTTGYTVTGGDITTANGTTFTTNQYVTTSLTPAARTETLKTTVIFDGEDVALDLTQNAPTLETISLTIGGSTSHNVSATATTVGDILVVANFKDSSNKDAGNVTVANSSLENAAGTDKWAVLSSETFATYSNGASIISVDANATNAVRTTNITVNYNNSAKTSNAVVITQSK